MERDTIFHCANDIILGLVFRTHIVRKLHKKKLVIGGRERRYIF